MSLRHLTVPLLLTLGTLLMPGCGSGPAKPSTKPVRSPSVSAPKPATPPPATPSPRLPSTSLPPVMLGIDVLEADGFKAIAGKKIGLLTHPAGVNRRGESTLDVLRRAPQTKLVALFAAEHGIYGKLSASKSYKTGVHAATGLPVYSLYSGNPESHKPTKAMLKGIDALVIDLQDIGVRSYTFSTAMLCAMAGCFEAGVEVIVLDRPNPLGGWKVDGPSLDADLKTYVGGFRVPYIHGLTMGELARLAKGTTNSLSIPKVINTPESKRIAGRLTVIPMRGWRRDMQWPETGLKWIPPSGLIDSYDAVVGNAMTGLGTQNTRWSTGLGPLFPYRVITFPKKTPEQIIAELSRYKIPGVAFRKAVGTDKTNLGREGVYVEITNWDAWRPTELSFYMHKTAAKWGPGNPFARLDAGEAKTFNIHLGAREWLEALRSDGAKIDVAEFTKSWSARAAVFQQQSRKFWLYL